MTIYVATQFLLDWLPEETTFTIFISIYIFATIFIFSGFLVHRTLKKKQLKSYMIFPQSFLIVGIIGYFLSFLLPISIISEQGSIYLYWGIVLASLITTLILVIKVFYNEFFIGECYLFIILLLFIPTVFDPSFFDISFLPINTNVTMAILFLGIILGGFLLGIKGVSFTPAIITLICLSIMSFVGNFTQNVSMIMVILALSGFSVRWILNHEISSKSNFYDNKISQLVLFSISQILPNIGIYVMILKRYTLFLPTWDLILSALIIQGSYFVLLSSQKRKIGKIFDNSYLNFLLSVI